MCIRDRSPHEGEAELLVCDFTDAFKHLRAAASERRFMAGAATQDGVPGFFVYLSILFGHIAGPLVWGRLGAALGRATASLHQPAEASQQC